MGIAAGLAGPAAAASWSFLSFEAQAAEGRGRHGADRSHERAQPPGREFRPDRRQQREERHERLNEDERRALHRDLDKANRELYRPRQR